MNVEEENNQEQGQQGEEDSGTESGNETLEEEASKTPAPEVNVREESFEGFVDSMNGNLWVINGLPMDVSSAEIKGSPSVGVIVKVEGYFNSNGMFIATKIEFIENGSNSGSSGSDDNGSGSENGNINESNHDNGNGNESHNENENRNENEGGGNSNEDNGNGG